MGNPGGDFRIAHIRQVGLVQLANSIKNPAADRTAHARRVFQVEDRLAGGTELHALMHGRQEAAGPIAGLDVLVLPLPREQHHVGREIVIRAAKPIGQPRAHRRPPGQRMPGLHESHPGIMVDRIRPHGTDERELIHHLAHVWQQIAHFDAGFAALRKPPMRAQDDQRRALQLSHALALGQAVWHGIAPEFVQLRLRVEGLELRRPAAHEQENDPLGTRRMVKASQRPPPTGRHCRRERTGSVQQPQRTQAKRPLLEEAAARREMVGRQVHSLVSVSSKLNNALQTHCQAACWAASKPEGRSNSPMRVNCLAAAVAD